MSLFRKAALDALNTPEKLDEPMRLLRQSYWSALVTFALFSSGLLLWSIFGRLPIRIEGSGLLVRADNLQKIQSESSGRVADIFVEKGDCLLKGQRLARIESTKEDLDRRKLISSLQLLVSQNKGEDLLANIRLAEIEKQLNRVNNQALTGAISNDELSNLKQTLVNTRIDILSRSNTRQAAIQDQTNQIKNIDSLILANSFVTSPKSGCVIDSQIKIGEVVQVGATMFELEGNKDQVELQSIAYFAPADGKRLLVGQKVKITPSTTKQQRHGGIQGRITRIMSIPVSEEAVTSRVGNSRWFASLKKGEGPMIEVHTSLPRSASTFSGYDWGGGPGPAIKFTAGTPTSLRVLVEERRPISYVMPILRDLSGIY